MINNQKLFAKVYVNTSTSPRGGGGSSTDLVSELVARERQDDELIGELGDQLVHLAVVPRGRASHGRHVLHQHHAAPEVPQRHALSAQRLAREVEQCLKL